LAQHDRGSARRGFLTIASAFADEPMSVLDTAKPVITALPSPGYRIKSQSFASQYPG
jgi:hypothetical protein